MENKIEQLIEAILFWKGEPVTKKKLAELTGLEILKLDEALNTLETSLQNRGIILMRKDDEVMLGTAPDASAIIENLTKEELSKELSKATLETLSIVLYMAPIKRSSIDYIRGVNSQFSLRHLEMRGFIEKITSETDSRVYLYRPTFELLSYLGTNSIEELSNWSEVKEKLASFEKQKDENEDIKEDILKETNESESLEEIS